MVFAGDEAVVSTGLGVGLRESSRRGGDGRGFAALGGRSIRCGAGRDVAVGAAVGVCVGAADCAACGAAIAVTGFFFRRGRRFGLGIIAFIDKLIRFIVGSTPITFTFTMSPTFTASRAS